MCVIVCVCAACVCTCTCMRAYVILFVQFQWLKFLTAFFQPVNITVTGDTQVGLFAEDYLNSMMDLYDRTDKR